MGHYDTSGNWVEDQNQSVAAPAPATMPVQNAVSLPPPAYSPEAVSQSAPMPAGAPQPVTQNLAPPQPPPAYLQDLQPGNASVNDPRLAALATAATQPAPKLPSMYLSSPGSPGGLTRVGMVANKALPAAAEGDLAAADAAARGVEAEGKGQGLAADAYADALGREEDMKPWEETLAQRKEKAKQDLFTRRMEIAEEEKGDRIDPRRMFHGEGKTWNRVLSALWVGLSGAPALDAIGRMIDDDVKAQHSELGAKKQSRNSELGAMASEVDRWGDAQAAQDKIKGDMWLSVAKQADMYAKSAANDKAKANAEAMRDQALANYNRTAVQMAEYLGSRVAYTPPSGGGVRINPARVAMAVEGGMDPKALEESVKSLQATGIDKATATAIALGYGPKESAETRKTRLEGQNKGGIDPITQQTTTVAKMYAEKGIPEAESALERLEALLSKHAGGELPGVGPVKGMLGESAWTSWLLSDEGKQMQQELQKNLNTYMKATGGAAITASELPRLMMGLVGPGFTSDGVRQGMAGLRQNLDGTKKSILAGVMPEAARLYETRRTGAAPGTRFDFQR